MTGRALGELAMLARLTRDLPGFLRTPITVERAAAVVRRRLETRHERFLGMAERAIYGHRRSPYLQLLRAAGCELGDLRAVVNEEGVEGALTRLAAAGVYVTFDEFKGRREVVRGSQRFTFAEADFDNPRVPAHVEMPTSGTRGTPSRVGWGLPHFTELAAATALALDAHGLSRPDHAVWRTSPVWLLVAAKQGQPTTGWFYPLRPLPLKGRLAGRYLAVIGRLAGHPFPAPVFADLQDPHPLVGWLGERARAGRPICVTTFVSSAVRLAVAAKEVGVALDGVAFISGGEPITAARRRTVEAVGGRVIPRYGTSEVSAIGYGCGDPGAPDDLHLFRDRYGLVRRARTVADSDRSIDAFLLTSLVPSVPKILLNVETGDYGVVERRECACKLGALGLRDHLSEIRSFEKLTGEGMTFVRTELVSILEETLPARFGGTAADYQVLEEEGRDGILRLLLLVSPRVGPVDEPELTRAFLEELGRGGQIDRFMAAMWRRAGMVEIRRRSPVATRGGKILPFHLLKGSEPAPVAPSSRGGEAWRWPSAH